MSVDNLKPVTAIIIGAGHRGKNYSSYAIQFPDLLKIVGVAEPRDEARNWVKKRFNLSDEHCFMTWEALANSPKLSDCVIIATQDQLHVQPATAFAKIGYHPPAKKLKELIESGLIGEVVNINHTEPVGFWHFAHSFVRGNWGNSERSTFSLLSKSCHDVDLITYWMGNKKCTGISSFGSLHHFRADKKPTGAASRCLDCSVENSCPYSAKKIYLDSCPNGPRWPMSAVCDLEDGPGTYLERLKEKLCTGPYGKCVYDTDNNVCDNQVVNFQFDDGATASLTMVAFTQNLCDRKTEVYGTRGQLVWNEAVGQFVEHFDFLSKNVHTIECEEKSPPNWGHGGADYFLMKSFIKAVSARDPSFLLSGPKVSLESHLLTFAAEYSRLNNCIVNPSKETMWKVE